MKILTKLSILTIIITLPLISGCDELNNLPVNVPVTYEFHTSGTNTSVVLTDNFCTSEAEEWQDYQDDIKSATFISAAYWTTNFSAGLQADINISISDNFGNQIFSVTLDNYKASENVETPYVLELDETEIQALNDYIENVLNQSNDVCFNITMSLTNVSGTVTPYVLDGKVELILEADVEL
jgi:hypothetical protein